MQSIFLVSLKWNINFNDADDGQCFAGNGNKPIKAFLSEKSANEFVKTWAKPITDAEKDTIVWPIQPDSRKIKDGLGFTLHDIDSDGSGFSLVVEEIDVEQN